MSAFETVGRVVRNRYLAAGLVGAMALTSSGSGCAGAEKSNTIVPCHKVPVTAVEPGKKVNFTITRKEGGGLSGITAMPPGALSALSANLVTIETPQGRQSGVLVNNGEKQGAVVVTSAHGIDLDGNRMTIRLPKGKGPATTGVRKGCYHAQHEGKLITPARLRATAPPTQLRGVSDADVAVLVPKDKIPGGVLLADKPILEPGASYIVAGFPGARRDENKPNQGMRAFISVGLGRGEKGGMENGLITGMGDEKGRKADQTTIVPGMSGGFIGTFQEGELRLGCTIDSSSDLATSRRILQDNYGIGMGGAPESIQFGYCSPREIIGAAVLAVGKPSD